MVFSEDSRVKIPCILHLVRLGYSYLSLKDSTWDEETNLFPVHFSEAIARINPGLAVDDISRLLTDVKVLLDNEDLGKGFYDRITDRSGIRLIDFENFDNNSFHVVTELTCKNGDDEFRPDITLLINGMPLAFIEVKKPNSYADIAGKNCSLSAGQYFDVKIEYSDLPPAQFAEKMYGFTERLDGLFKDSAALELEIKEQLARVRYAG